MPTITLRANTTAERAVAAVAAAAEMERFTIEEQSPTFLAAQKGTVLTGILLGVGAPYLRFTADVSAEPDGLVRLVIRWKRPWWQGILGLIRSRRTMRRIVEWVTNGLTETGGG